MVSVISALFVISILHYDTYYTQIYTLFHYIYLTDLLSYIICESDIDTITLKRHYTNS